jgi:hypothetical protein
MTAIRRLRNTMAGGGGRGGGGRGGLVFWSLRQDRGDRRQKRAAAAPAAARGPCRAPTADGRATWKPQLQRSGRAFGRRNPFQAFSPPPPTQHEVVDDAEEGGGHRDGRLPENLKVGAAGGKRKAGAGRFGGRGRFRGAGVGFESFPVTPPSRARPPQQDASDGKGVRSHIVPVVWSKLLNSCGGGGERMLSAYSALQKPFH